MDTPKVIMLVLGIVAAVAFPVQLVRQIRRGDKGRLFELVVSTAGLGIIFVSVFRPNVLHSAPAPVRWLTIAVSILVVATQFGFGQWLFRPKAKTGPPPE